MTRTARLALFFAACVCVAGLYGSAVSHVGQPNPGYGDLINRLTVSERHITDAVTAVNFDFRGFDTLGEEYIMFASVLGVAVLLRKQRDEAEGPPLDKLPGRRISAASDAVRIIAVTLVGPMVLFGIYIVVHGQVTPGGGFQGGVVLATAPLLIYLAGEFESLRKLAPRWFAETGEAIGAGGYGIIGAGAMFAGASFLTNYLPLGKPGDVFSGGTVALIDLTVGLEVAGGFLLLLLIFLEEVLVLRDPV